MNRIRDANTDQENLQWAWLRAVEWGRWPIFLSQPIAPVALIWLRWRVVVGAVIAANIAWALFARYKFVSLRAAASGALFVRFKWACWPLATALLFYLGRRPECWIGLSWSVLIFPLGISRPST